MACERTSKRVARLAGQQLRNSPKAKERSVAASALRAARKPRGRS